MKSKIMITLASTVAGVMFFAEVSLASNTIKTYLPFSYPVDPVKIVTIADMDLSYALGSTLVEWGKDKQIVAGLASKWEVTSSKVMRFHIRSGLKWSDGAPLTSHQVKSALESAFKRFPEDLRAVIAIVESIRTPSDQLVDFHLKVDAASSNLLGKLTEPQYATFVIKTSSNDVDLKKTVGAFSLEQSTPSELSLKRNPHWFKYRDEIVSQVIIRKPDSKKDLGSALLTDPWANVIETSSMISEETIKDYKQKGFSVWTRPLDKMLYFQIAKRMENDTGLKLIRFLRTNLDRLLLSRGLSGLSKADQAFPVGFQLHDPKIKCASTAVELPEVFKNRPLKIVISPARVGQTLKTNLVVALTQITGQKPEVVEIDLENLSNARKATDYDLYFGTMGLADPDPEGAMSYYLEGDMPVIPSIGKSFIADLDQARKVNPAEKLTRFRSILSQAYCEGHFLPVFHLSTVGIGKPEISFAELSETDESITFSKIRFKEKQP